MDGPNAPLVAESTQEASYEAHMAASDVLAVWLGRAPTPGEVAMVLAHAYGEAVALFSVSGAGIDQIEALGRMHKRAAEGMAAHILKQDCKGSA